MAKNISVRMPDDLHALIKESADADHRSVNSQILWLLETGLISRGGSQHNAQPASPLPPHGQSQGFRGRL